jgi:hypothetical protein
MERTMEHRIAAMLHANKSVYKIARELNLSQDDVIAVMAKNKIAIPRYITGENRPKSRSAEAAADACKWRHAIEDHVQANIDKQELEGLL